MSEAKVDSLESVSGGNAGIDPLADHNLIHESNLDMRINEIFGFFKGKIDQRRSEADAYEASLGHDCAICQDWAKKRKRVFEQRDAVGKFTKVLDASIDQQNDFASAAGRGIASQCLINDLDHWTPYLLPGALIEYMRANREAILAGFSAGLRESEQRLADFEKEHHAVLVKYKLLP